MKSVWDILRIEPTIPNWSLLSGIHRYTYYFRDGFLAGPNWSYNALTTGPDEIPCWFNLKMRLVMAEFLIGLVQIPTFLLQYLMIFSTLVGLEFLVVSVFWWFSGVFFPTQTVFSPSEHLCWNAAAPRNWHMDGLIDEFQRALLRQGVEFTIWKHGEIIKLLDIIWYNYWIKCLRSYFPIQSFHNCWIYFEYDHRIVWQEAGKCI